MRTAGRFLARQLRARPLAAFSLCFLAGALLAGRFHMPTEHLAAAAMALIAAALPLGAFGRRRRRQAALLALAAGVALGGLRLNLALDAVPAVRRTLYSVPMEGWIVSEPYTNPVTGRVISKFRVDTLDGEPANLCVRLYLRGDAEPLSAIDCGQRLSLTGHIWANDPVTNPYEFDFAAYLRRNGMSAMATAKIEDAAVLATRRDAGTVIVDVRRALSRRVDALFPGSAPLVRALLLGDRSQLSEELRDSLRETGTAHLICISGLHVTVLASALAALFGLFMGRRRANALAVLLLVPYGAMIGFTPSFLRALLMFAVLSFAPAAGRNSDGVTRLCAAMLACLMLRPLSVTDAGFVLSFSATAGLILLLPPLERLFGVARIDARIPDRSPLWVAPGWRLAAYLLKLLCASLAAQLASLPAVVAFFGVQPLLSLPFNLVCVPLCMLGYLLALAALLVSCASMAAAALPALAADRLLSLMSEVTRMGGSLPLTAVRVGRYPLALILLHGAIMLAASELSRVSQRLRSALPLALLLVAALSTGLTFARSWPFRIVFLDADQADCAVVTTRGHTYMIDTGDTYTPAADYLSATCLKLDGVFLSHPHQDHAGGLTDVLTMFRPGAIYVPEGWTLDETTSMAVVEGMALAEGMGVPVVPLSTGDSVPLSEAATLTVYGPDPAHPPELVNDLSMLALVESGGHGALFTGDLEITGEPEAIPRAEVLKVAHHGSGDATSPRFLEACDPDIAVISVGDNSFGHPDPDVVARLEASGAQTLLTRKLGAITLTLWNGAWRVHTYLEASR